MNWNQLQYIVTTAQEKSITKAARKLFISQPSLTLSIQNLEKELGVELFERSRGSLTLTYAGQLFYDWALSTLHSREKLDARIGDIKDESSHLIRLGVSPHRSAILLPRILPRFYELFPHSEVFLEERPTYRLRTMLEEDQLDLIIDVPHPDSLNYQNIFSPRNTSSWPFRKCT
jgi:DNA-binding transcriptional LysR family regulator